MHEEIFKPVPREFSCKE
jgi:hypothetical protein